MTQDTQDKYLDIDYDGQGDDDVFFSVPVSKLDADHYLAEDLDGVTESLFGSGNMAYASMQASQSDADLITRGDFAFNNEDQGAGGEQSVRISGQQENNNSEDFDIEDFSFAGESEPAIDPMRSGDSNGDGGIESLETSDGNFAASTVGSVSAVGETFDSPNSNGSNAGGDFSQTDITTNTNNSIVQNDSSETNEGDTVIENTVNLDVGDIFIEAGDINLDFGDLTERIENVFNDLISFDQTINEILTNIDLGLGPDIDLNLDLGLITDIDLSLGLGNEGGGDGLISQTVDPVAEDLGNILNDVTHGAGEEVIEAAVDAVDDVTSLIDGLTGGITAPILGQNNNNQGGTDSDIVADLGIDILQDTIVAEPLEIAIDQVEDLVGDIDIAVDPTLDLFNHDAETDNQNGDTDITIDTNIDIVDETIAEVVADIPLDPVEEIVGDIDLDIDAAADLLGDIADPLVNDGEGGTGEDTLVADIGDALEDIVDPVIDEALDLIGNNDNNQNQSDDTDDTSWTESTIGDAGLFDDFVDGLADAAEVLPDPTGTVAEGLGALDIEPEIDLGSLGGLFG